jgi:branched-chain amino acid aminotransferase
MPIPKAEWIWMNGQLVPWDQAQVHVLTHAIHFGSSAYEGVRAYPTRRGPAIFRLDAHVDRLYYSCKVLSLDVPFTKEQFMDAVQETVRANRHKACYIRPIIFGGYGALDLFVTEENRIDVVVASWEREAYYGTEAQNQGVDVAVSSWRRPAPGTLPLMAKLGGHYVSSQLAAREAQTRGFAEGIMLDVNGHVSEGPGENLFIVHGGIIYTAPLGASVLPGITRNSVITLAQERGYTIREELLAREMLYLADEVFMTGTAAEVTPVRSVDHLPVGEGKGRGPVTQALQEAFFGIVGGEAEDRHGWITYVNKS